MHEVAKIIQYRVNGILVTAKIDISELQAMEKMLQPVVSCRHHLVVLHLVALVHEALYENGGEHGTLSISRAKVHLVPVR